LPQASCYNVEEESQVSTRVLFESSIVMPARHAVLAALLILYSISFGRAAGTVQLELVGDRSAAPAFQEWSKALGKGGIPDVRIRSGSEDELKPAWRTPAHPIGRRIESSASCCREKKSSSPADATSAATSVG
jgi:hypothetical protein